MTTTPDHDLDGRLDCACALARDAGATILRAFRARATSDPLTFKGPQDYVTATDGEIERMVRARLGAAFPKDAFFGEEAGGSFGPDVWIVDPIDGTANFARGIPAFCISIAFVHDRQLALGVIYDPVHDELFAARRGGGATRNGEVMRVSGISDVADAMIEVGWSTRVPTQAYVGLVSQIVGQGAQVRRCGSGALGLAYVAAGRIDGYCELHINAWDALAGLILIEEAGGWTNDFLAGDGLQAGNPVIACTPALKDALARVISSAQSDQGRK